MREKIYNFIEPSDNKSIYDYCMIVVIAVSLLPLCFKQSNGILTAIDYATTFIFIIDYALRLLTADFKLRKGEALALTYADIDKENKVIHITKSLAYKYNTPYIKDPKTAAGVRDVPLLDELAPFIPDGEPHEFVFSPDGENRPMSMMVFQRKWANFQKATGITCTAHQLRHSFATMLYDADVDVKQAQDILGHTTEAMTMDVYTKISERKRKSAADNLNAFIKSKHSNDTADAAKH